MPAILLFPFGLIIGSFATAVAHRLPRGESVVTGRSRCPGCGEMIAAYDNVPVFSWLALRGRCRRCAEPISARYPVTELAMALLFTATAFTLGTDDLGELALGLVLCATLVTITLTDLERRVIPNAVLAVSAAIGLGIIVATDPASLPERAAAALGAGGLLFIVAVAYPRGMGMGDVKLAAVMGLFLGRAVVPALAVAITAGALVGLVMMARQGSGARKSAIPFGPFLALGGIVGLLAGDAMLDAYLNAFVRQ
ncbi:MAG: prepilin peptidase [Solirubrobacterales bacterium]|nr:prepilin peptidase [Solirubrobacterales bacterium]